MKKLIALLLAAAMLLLLFAGCGNSSAQSAAEPEETSAEASAAEQAEEEAAEPAEADEAPAAAAEEASIVDSAEEAGEAEGAEEAPRYEPCTYDLPLTEETVTYSIFANFPPYLSGYLDTYADQVAYIEWQERTGISLEFYESSDRDAMATQISLMAASGDYYDLLFNLTQFYSGGLVKAIDDEIILDLADLADEYAPNYMCIVTQDEEHEKSVYDDDGQMGAIYAFVDVVAAQNGAIIRSDWLDDLGLDVPETLSDWHEVLTAFKNAYNISDPFFLTASGQNSYNLCGCFGTAGMAGASMGLYHDGEEVKCGLLDDSFVDYLKMIQTWYNEGLISSDFYTNSEEIRDSGVEEKVLNGQCGIFYSPANTIADYVSQNVDPNAELIALAEPTADDGTVNTFGDFPSYLGDNCISISTTAPQPELAVQCLDYLFTDEGKILCNYGIEGQAFEYDANGDPQWTDLIVNNDEGIPVEQWCRVKYTLIDMPSLFTLERTWASYNDEQIAAITEKWNAAYDNTLPSLALTTEENERFNALYSDIDTYVDENIIKYIIGDLSFDNWSDFTADLEQMGVQECIDIYQQAYNRYLAR